MSRRRRLKGGKKYETEEKFNDAVQKFILLFRDQAVAYLERENFNLNLFVDRIEFAYDYIYNMENANLEFKLNSEISEFINELLNNLIDRADERNPGIREIFNLKTITKEFNSDLDTEEKRKNLLRDVNSKSTQLLEKFGFDGFDEFDRDDYIYWISKSTRPGMERTYLVSYVMKKRNGETVNEIGHRITLICTDDGLIYYDSGGRTFEDLPEDLQKWIKDLCGPILETNIIQHQGDAPICERHSLLRACNSHLSNEEYHTFLLQEADARGFTYDELVWVLTEHAFWEEVPSLDLTKKGKGKRRKPCIYYFIK